MRDAASAMVASVARDGCGIECNRVHQIPMLNTTVMSHAVSENV